GDGPAQYFADTPVGAWAEFLRHEGITDEADLLQSCPRDNWASAEPRSAQMASERQSAAHLARSDAAAYGAARALASLPYWIIGLPTIAAASRTPVPPSRH